MKETNSRGTASSQLVWSVEMARKNGLDIVTISSKIRKSFLHIPYTETKLMED